MLADVSSVADLCVFLFRIFEMGSHHIVPASLKKFIIRVDNVVFCCSYINHRSADRPICSWGIDDEFHNFWKIPSLSV